MLKKAIIFLIFGVFLLNFAYSQVKNEMILVQGGTFLMGSPEGEIKNNPASIANETPQHTVTVKSFLLAKYPVTQVEFENVMDSNPSQTKGQDNPADSISWNMAVDYCNKRSIKEDLTPVYKIDGNNVTWDRSANGYRLPTESEWEYACRAGTQTPFYSGDSMDDAGWHRGNSAVVVNGYNTRSSKPVGQKQPNKLGIYDMHGNVLEWCWDYFAPYTAEAKNDPIGPDKPLPGTPLRVYRGGYFDIDSSSCRSGYRFRQHQGFRMFYVGFRVARNAQ